MFSKAIILNTLIIFIHYNNYSQDYFSYGSGNYGGINQLIANPAAAADNRLKIDLVLTGAEFNFNNSWFGIKREALQFTGNFFHPYTLKLPPTWKNTTPNVPDNVYKNFNIVPSKNDHAVIFENRLQLPSILYQIDPKNSIAFCWALRQIGNVDGISEELGYLFENELDFSVTQNNTVQNESLSAVQMTWAEYGLTYGRVLKDKNKHFIKAGITPKLLFGLESAYLIVKNLDFLLSTKDSLSYFNADFSYAHSANFTAPFRSGHSPTEFYRHVTSPALGLDLGFIYEWRPHYQKFKYKTDGKHLSWRQDLNKYKIKFGASLVDLGKIKFSKEGSSYDLNIRLKNSDISRYSGVSDKAMLDSLLRADFSNQNQSNTYSILLPTAINTQLDYAVNSYLFLNLSTHLSNFFPSTLYKVHNYTAICFAPRIEQYWYEISLPFTFNTLSADRFKYVMTGLNLRLGYLSIGTNNLKTLFKGDVTDMNFYAILKLNIPYKKITDQDHDGVKDQMDECPDDAGELELKGCPDIDHDKVPDKLDACPHQAGIQTLRGCPDTDEDGITDGDDACPHNKGLLFMNGCPDSDTDSIPDHKDLCPDAAGSKLFHGCPDTDQDGIIDPEDLCPSIKGMKQYKGCPDTDGDLKHDGIDLCIDIAGPSENNGCPWPDSDKDGVIDRLDSCLSIPGLAVFKGCPESPKLKPAEKRILQIAFSSLEFETGKAIIKARSFTSLSALAKLLKTHQSDWEIKLSGHTDDQGTAADNLILSEQRTKEVQKYLSKKGVPPEMIYTEWFGQSQPIANNATKEGRQKNRRVEMKVLLRTNK